MPGYGVQSAAVTLIGQSVGAKRKDLVTRLGWVTVLLGMGVMLVASALMYALAPWIIGMLSPDRQVVLLDGAPNERGSLLALAREKMK